MNSHEFTNNNQGVSFIGLQRNVLICLIQTLTDGEQQTYIRVDKQGFMFLMGATINYSPQSNLECQLNMFPRAYRICQTFLDILDYCIGINMVGWFMVFNATFNNISVISWRSVLLVEDTGVTEENHRPVVSY